MRLMDIRRARGLRLARNIPAADPRQMPLLRANAVVSDKYVRALVHVGIRAGWVDGDLSEGIEPVDLIPPHVREQTARAMTGALDGARRAFQLGQALSPGVSSSLHEVVEQIGDSVARHRGASVALSDLASIDAYTHQHSIDVCALGMLIGRAMFERAGWCDDRGRRRMAGVE